MTFLEELAQLLDTLGLGDYHADGSIGGTIYHPVLPTAPDVCMAIALYGGPEALVADGYAQPSIQIRVRGTQSDARVAEQSATDVYQTLHGLPMPRTLAGGTLLANLIGAQSGPIYAGQDANGRHEYTVNFRTEIRRSA